MLKKTFTLFTALLVLLLIPLAQAAPKIEHWTTANGLRVYYVSAPELPMLDLSLMFDAGSARDGDKQGTALLTSAMLNKGAGELNEDQLAEQFDAIGANFSAGSSMDNASVSLRTITLEKELKTAIGLYLQVLSQPTFPQVSFDRVQKLVLVGLQAEKQDPETLASKAFYKALYPEHPYGQPTNGSEETIQALTVPDLQAFYKQYYVAKNGLLTMVGAVDRKQAEALAEQVASALPAGEAAAPIPEVKPLTAAKTVRIPYPSAQSHILVGQVGDKRGDPDYFTLYMGNQILGGSGFTSRLMKEVRDARGLSYSVYSYFGPFKELGVFEVGLQTKKAQTQEALNVVRDTISKFQSEGPTEEELVAAKKDVTGGFPLRTASNSQIASYVGVIAFYGLPLDYLETFTDKINVLTREDITDAFKRRVQPDNMVTVIVGEDGESKSATEASKQDTDAQKTSQPAPQGQ